MRIKPAVFKHIDERNHELVENWTYEWDWRGRQYKILVFKGAVTDFASVPRLFWPLIRPGGLHAEGALGHDMLYRYLLMPNWSTAKSNDYWLRVMGPDGEWMHVYGSDLNYWGRRKLRKFADDMFLSAMEARGTGWLKRSVMYRVVRTFGGLHVGWNRTKVKLLRKLGTKS